MGVPQFSKKDFVLNLIEKKNQLEQNINSFGQILAVVSSITRTSHFLVTSTAILIVFSANSSYRTITLVCENLWLMPMVIREMTSMSTKFVTLDIK